MAKPTRLAISSIGRSLDSRRILRKGGVLVSFVGDGGEPADRQKAAELGGRMEGMLVEADNAGMRAIAELAEQSKLRPHLEATFPLAEAAKAHAQGETGRVTGKMVLVVR